MVLCAGGLPFGDCFLVPVDDFTGAEFSALQKPVAGVSLVFKRLSSLVLMQQFLPAKYVEHCHRPLLGRL
jgi:hypothetical protein